MNSPGRADGRAELNCATIYKAMDSPRWQLPDRFEIVHAIP